MHAPELEIKVYIDYQKFGTEISRTDSDPNFFLRRCSELVPKFFLMKCFYLKLFPPIVLVTLWSQFIKETTLWIIGQLKMLYEIYSAEIANSCPKCFRRSFSLEILSAKIYCIWCMSQNNAGKYQNRKSLMFWYFRKSGKHRYFSKMSDDHFQSHWNISALLESRTQILYKKFASKLWKLLLINDL